MTSSDVDAIEYAIDNGLRRLSDEVKGYHYAFDKLQKEVELITEWLVVLGIFAAVVGTCVAVLMFTVILRG